MSRLDLEACMGVLEAREREAVLSFADTLGLDAWADCSPLRRIVVAVAVMRLGVDLPESLSALGRLREALWSLGAGHDGARLAETIAKALRRWQRDSGQNFRTGCGVG